MNKATIVKYTVIAYILIICILAIGVSPMKLNTIKILIIVLAVNVFFAYLIYIDSKKRRIEASTWVYLALIGNWIVWALYHCLKGKMKKMP